MSEFVERALFVYEPNEQGGYQPRRELYRFPDHSWVYDIEKGGVIAQLDQLSEDDRFDCEDYYAQCRRRAKKIRDDD